MNEPKMRAESIHSSRGAVRLGINNRVASRHENRLRMQMPRMQVVAATSARRLIFACDAEKPSIIAGRGESLLREVATLIAESRVRTEVVDRGINEITQRACNR